MPELEGMYELISRYERTRERGRERGTEGVGGWRGKREMDRDDSDEER